MISTLLNHKSIRKYTSQAIDGFLLNQILEAGTRASTTGNMQVYSVIVTQNPEMKEKLAPHHFNQPMVKQAPVVLTFCADYNRFSKWCKLSKAEPRYDNFMSFLCGAIDAVLVAQNVCIAAESNGLGICYLGTVLYTADKIIDLLKLPKGVVPVATVTLGYPAENPGQTDRLPLEAVVHYETYQDYADEDIKTMHIEKEQLPANIAFIKENNKKSLAQVFTDVRYTKKDNVAFSKVLLDVLTKQGFMNQ